MKFHSNINELIESVDDMDINYRKLHTNAYINVNDKDTIKIPYKSIIREYFPYLQDIVIQAQLTDDELSLYKYKPKKLSLDLYDTTELWSILLELNNMYSVIDFNLEKQPKIFDPNEFKPMINEIMIMEGLIY